MGKVISFNNKRCVYWCARIGEDQRPYFDIDDMPDGRVMVLIFASSWDEALQLRDQAQNELNKRR